jgi:hypothetical protein
MPHLDELTQQIAQHESELQRLRRDFEARRNRLAELTQRRDEIQAQLRQVEADIDAVTSGREQAAEKAPPAPDVNGPPATSSKPATRPTLTDAVIEVLREMDRPMTAKQLGDELVRRKFPTKSGNIKRMVQNRLTELVSKGVLRRAKGQPGVILAKAKPATAPPKTAAAPPKAAPRSGQPSLASLLTKLLQKSRKPVPARELAEQVLATGYQSTSKDFNNVVLVSLNKLENAEHIKGEGWRLKKR